MRQSRRSLLPIALIGLIVLGCQGVTVKKVGRREAESSSQGYPSVSAAGSPPAPDLRNPGTSEPATLIQLAGASDRAGRGSVEASPELALAYDLDAITRSAAAMAAIPEVGDGGQVDPRFDAARAIYNDALARFLRITSGRRMRLDGAWRDGLAARGVRISLRADAAVWSPDQFDEFLFATDYVVRGKIRHFGSEGVGVPLIAIKRFKFKEFEERRGREKFLMPRQVYPVTALLKVVNPGGSKSGDTPEFRLELHDPLRCRRVRFAGRVEPLARDLTTPLAYHFARSPLPFLQEVGLLDPQRLEKLAGLYMLHPYEPGKIPVVLVHGLRSSPVAWLKVINELRGDPALSDRYQFWLFMYPSGTPFPLSAATLRQALGESRQAVDPGHADPALDRMVLVGHSMGGLISKMMVLESGDALWKLVSTRPIDGLQASPETRAMLKRVFFFEPYPSIRRVVFIATPHRGSELGDQFIGRLADRLIRLPNPLRATYRALLAQNGPDAFTPGIRAGLPSSIDELRRDNPLLLTLGRLPIRPEVAFHSIIGQKQEGPLEAITDGVVPYASAHLDGAASERIVRGDHGCQDGLDTIAELRRILTLHLKPVVRESRVTTDAGAPALSPPTSPDPLSPPPQPDRSRGRPAGG